MNSDSILSPNHREPLGYKDFSKYLGYSIETLSRVAKKAHPSMSLYMTKLLEEMIFGAAVELPTEFQPPDAIEFRAVAFDSTGFVACDIARSPC